MEPRAVTEETHSHDSQSGVVDQRQPIDAVKEQGSGTAGKLKNLFSGPSAPHLLCPPWSKSRLKRRRPKQLHLLSKPLASSRHNLRRQQKNASPIQKSVQKIQAQLMVWLRPLLYIRRLMIAMWRPDNRIGINPNKRKTAVNAP